MTSAQPHYFTQRQRPQPSPTTLHSDSDVSPAPLLYTATATSAQPHYFTQRRQPSPTTLHSDVCPTALLYTATATSAQPHYFTQRRQPSPTILHSDVSSAGGAAAEGAWRGACGGLSTCPCRGKRPDHGADKWNSKQDIHVVSEQCLLATPLNQINVCAA